MRALALIACSLTALAGWADTATYKLSLKGKSVGTLKLEQTLLAGGKLLVREVMDMNGPGGRFSVDETRRVAADGRTESISATLNANGTKVKITVSFDAKGAHAAIDVGGKKSTKTVAPPKGKITADASNFWFIRDKPKVGTKVAGVDFRTSKMDWEDSTTQYMGPVTVTHKGKKVTAHLLIDPDSKQWLDDKGMPIRVESNEGLVAERQ